MSDDEVGQKFVALATRAVAPERARRALDALWPLDSATCVRDTLEPPRIEG